MKKAIFLISLVTLCYTAFTQDEWTLIHPYPTINNLLDAHFISEQEGWVVGTDGLIMYTNDGCETWITQHSNPEESLWSIFFIDDNEGWVAGWSTIYHTTDKGETWEEQTHPSVMGDLTDIYFVNHDTGWVVGTYKIVLKTTDGGKSWTKIMNNIYGDKCFYSVEFTDELHGCAVGGLMSYSNLGFTMVTSDGGLTWQETTPTDSKEFKRVIFLDSVTGWICGYNGGLYKTSDGGNTWIDKGNIYHFYTNYDIHFFNDTSGILINHSTARLTFDSGETWDSLVYINNSASVNRFSSWCDNEGITVGYSGSIHKTIDGGFNWENLNSNMSFPFYDIAFFNSLEGFGIVNNYSGTHLISTYDGGYSWESDTIVANGDFYRMYMHGSNCYLLNKSSQMMKTTNEGEEWVLLDVPNLGYQNGYNDIQFVNDNTGYMCGNTGILVKTIDGGETWVNKTLVDEYNFSSMFFITEDKGWLIDYSGQQILRTQTGGNGWTFTTLGEDNTFQPVHVFFINENEGFVSTEEGVLFKTTNGGNTWEEFYVFPSGYYSEIYFVSENEGWFRSGYAIYHTFDGGETWVNHQMFGFTPLRSLFFLNSNEGWIGGGSGLIATYNLTVDINNSEYNIPSATVSPNPAKHKIEVKLLDKSDKINDVKIFSMQGKQVMYLENVSEPNTLNINVSELISGTYIIYITSDKRENLVKFIVQ
ncbi:MAG: YCF48-related protein [Bacteroidota bacterium]